jgi:hypothetical protein
MKIYHLRLESSRLEARRTGADVANGSPVPVSIANEDRPYLAVIVYGRPEVWKKDTRSWRQRIATPTAKRRGCAGSPAR